MTSVALGHLRIRLVSASCASSFTAQFVPPDPLLERVAWVCNVSLSPCPKLACSLIRRTFSRSALPHHEARSQWRTHFSPPPLGALCFLTTLPLTLSPLRVSPVLTRARQIRCSLLVQRTRHCALQVSRVCAKCGLPPVVTLHSLFPMVASSSALFLQPRLALRCGSISLSSLVVPVVKRDGDPTSLDSHRPISLASCAFKVFEHLTYARIGAPHPSTT